MRYSKIQILYIKCKMSFYTTLFQKVSRKKRKKESFFDDQAGPIFNKKWTFSENQGEKQKKRGRYISKKRAKNPLFFRKKEVFDVVSSKIFQIGLKWIHIFRKIFRIKIKNRKKSLYRPPVYPCVNNVFHAVWRVCPGSKKGLL